MKPISGTSGRIGSAKWAAIAVGIGITVLCVAAAPTPSSSTDSDHSSKSTDHARPNRADSNARPSQYWRDRATTKPSADERQDIDEFMNENSPKRWAKFKDMPETRQDKLIGFVAQRYRMLQDLRQNDSAMYDLRVKRLKIEDDIFALGWDLRTNKDKGDSSTDATRSELKKRVKALVDSRIEEHRLRFKQIQERLEQERKRLNDEQAGEEKFVKDSMDALENDMRWPGMNELVMPLPGRSPSGNPGRETYLAPATQSSKPEK